LNPKKRPSRHEAVSIQVVNDCGKFTVILNYDNEGNVSVIDVKSGKSGGCIHCEWGRISRQANLSLEYHAPIKKVIECIRWGHCPIKPSCGQLIADAIEGGLIDANNQA
jgi:hypothetical protein